jgi:hypothetical protein
LASASTMYRFRSALGSVLSASATTCTIPFTASCRARCATCSRARPPRTPRAASRTIAPLFWHQGKGLSCQNLPYTHVT